MVFVGDGSADALTLGNVLGGPRFRRLPGLLADVGRDLRLPAQVGSIVFSGEPTFERQELPVRIIDTIVGRVQNALGRVPRAVSSGGFAPKAVEGRTIADVVRETRLPEDENVAGLGETIGAVLERGLDVATQLVLQNNRVEPRIVPGPAPQLAAASMVPAVARAAGNVALGAAGALLATGGGGGGAVAPRGIRVQQGGFHETAAGNVVATRQWVEVNPSTGRLQAFKRAKLRIVNETTRRRCPR